MDTEIIFYTISPVNSLAELPVQLQSNTQYTGTTCWFNLLDEKSGSNTTNGATSPEFSYVKEEADQVIISIRCSQRHDPNGVLGTR